MIFKILIPRVFASFIFNFNFDLKFHIIHFHVVRFLVQDERKKATKKTLKKIKNYWSTTFRQQKHVQYLRINGKPVCRLDSKSSFTVDVEVFYCTEAPYGCLKLKLDGVPGVLMSARYCILNVLSLE